jgi:hypothetical protein
MTRLTPNPEILAGIAMVAIWLAWVIAIWRLA